MKKLILAAAMVIAGSAHGGVRIETVTRDIKTQSPDGPASVLLVQDGNVRTSGDRGNSVIIKDGSIYILDDDEKTYRQMDRAQMQQMAGQASAAMAQMQARMKDMPPEQRAMMERMMGGQLPGGMSSGKPDVWAAQDTGKNDTVAGRQCRVWNLTRNGKPFEELCVVPYPSLAGKENLEKAFRDLADAFGDLAQAMPNADAGAKGRLDVKGYPIRTRSYDAGGKYRGSETVLSKWAEESIPAATFEVPKGYAKQSMPGLGGN
jgi:hypothetical protein